MTSPETQIDSFTVFVRDVEPRLKVALCSSFGREIGIEATADALEYAWKNWERVGQMDNPAGYLWRVGRNRARRRSTRRTELFQGVAMDRIPWVEPALPDALAALSEKQRISVLMVYGLGWTFAEVAELLGVSRSTVQRHADRAMRRLRRKLGVLS